LYDFGHFLDSVVERLRGIQVVQHFSLGVGQNVVALVLVVELARSGGRGACMAGRLLLGRAEPTSLRLLSASHSSYQLRWNDPWALSVSRRALIFASAFEVIYGSISSVSLVLIQRIY